MTTQGAKPNPASADQADLAIGQLLVDFGLITLSQLEEALKVSRQTRLVLGKVLVVTQQLSEPLLKSALECQGLLRDRQMDMPTARAAMQLLHYGQAGTLEEALKKLGFAKPVNAGKVTLADILIESGLVTREQYQGSVAKSEETGLPSGRLLVLSGYLNEAALTAALNSHGLVQAGKVSFEDAITSLKSMRRRTQPQEPQRVERDFYDLPEGQSSLLGELLIQAGCLTKDQLANAIEMGVAQGRPIGETLAASNFLTTTFLHQALEVQKMVLSKECSQGDGIKLLIWIDREHLSISEARARLRVGSEPTRRVTFAELAKILGLVTDAEIDKAVEAARQNTELMLQMLLQSGARQPESLKAAAMCNNLVESGRLTVERACILFDYARKKGVSIDQALKDLNWYQGAVSEALDNNLQDSDFEALKTQAERLFQEGRFEEAEQHWTKVVAMSQKFGTDHPNHVRSVERLADVYSRLGRLEQAETLYSRCLITKSRVLPPNSLHTAASINNLAKVYYFLGRYTDAENFAVKFLEMYRANFPADHPDVACALQNLATLYHMQNKFNQAEPYYAKAMKICQDKLGLSHPTTVRLCKNYSRLLRSLKRDIEADTLDPEADGKVTGSWKAIAVPADHSLFRKDD